MPGTIPLSMTQQFDEFGEPLNGGYLYIYVAGTVSDLQDAFQDYALTIPMPHPMQLDATGRIPQFFLADGFVKVRLTDAQGVVQLAADFVLVIGPPIIEEEEEGGSGDVFELGDMIARYGTGARTGFVRCNNNTIGSEFSGATERANSDCQDLYEYLWAIDATLEVSGGRGATAADDWAADKPIALPDWRACALAGMEDMGGGDSGRLPAEYVTPFTVLGSYGGVGSVGLGTAHLPAQTPSGTINLNIGAVTLTTTPPTAAGLLMYGGTGGNQAGGGAFDFVGASISINQAASSASFTGTAFPGQSGQAFVAFGPRRNCTIYIKL